MQHRLEPLDFWRWAYSDLRSNAVRGVLAEYLVGLALGVDMTVPRTEWAPWDLLTPEGIKVEVKCGAYVQAWAPPEKPSQVRYSGLLARSWIEGTAGSYTDEPGVRADVYVFALQTCRDPEAYDALNLNQWEFRVVPGAVVTCWDQQSVALTRLTTLGYAAVDAEGLPTAVREAASTRAAVTTVGTPPPRAHGLRGSGASLSADGMYRYSLHRVWEPDDGLAVWVLLNPSTADAAEDDNTSRRVEGFTRSWGLGGYEIVNLFALRATDPKTLVTHPDPVGPGCDEAMAAATARATLVVAAWGASWPLAHAGRVREVRERLTEARCLGLTTKGQPRHPLYLSTNTTLVPL